MICKMSRRRKLPQSANNRPHCRPQMENRSRLLHERRGARDNSPRRRFLFLPSYSSSPLVCHLVYIPRPRERSLFTSISIMRHLRGEEYLVYINTSYTCARHSTLPLNKFRATSWKRGARPVIDTAIKSPSTCRRGNHPSRIVHLSHVEHLSGTIFHSGGSDLALFEFEVCLNASGVLLKQSLILGKRCRLKLLLKNRPLEMRLKFEATFCR